MMLKETNAISAGYKTQHPQYMQYEKRWKRMADVTEGEDVIKEKDTLYLPKPGGLRDLEGENRKEANEEWQAYKQRATFPTWTRDAIRAMTGLVRKLDADIDLPKQLEYLKESATGDGFTLDQLYVRVVSEVLTYGRVALWVDIDNEGKPYIATYDALSLVNWKEGKGSSGNDLKLAVMLEREEKGDDEFSHESYNVYRVASLDENGLKVRLFRESTAAVEAVEIEPTAFGGKRIDDIPLVIVGSRDNAPDVDDIPLEGMALNSIKFYEESADYYKALHMSSHPILVAAGAETDGVIKTGPGLCWQTRADAKVYYVESTCEGIDKHRAAMDALKNGAVEIGARAMDTSGAESGEARKARQDDQRATLSTCVTTAAQGIERALRYCAQFAGLEADDVHFNVKADFNAHDVDPQMVAQLSALVTSGVISAETLYEYIRTGKMPEHDYTEELTKVQATMGTIGNPADAED